MKTGPRFRLFNYTEKMYFSYNKYHYESLRLLVYLHYLYASKVDRSVVTVLNLRDHKQINQCVLRLTRRAVRDQNAVKEVSFAELN